MNKLFISILLFFPFFYTYGQSDISLRTKANNQKWGLHESTYSFGDKIDENSAMMKNREQYVNDVFYAADSWGKAYIGPVIVTNDHGQLDVNWFFSHDWDDILLIYPKTAATRVYNQNKNWIIVTDKEDEVIVYYPAQIKSVRSVKTADDKKYNIYVVDILDIL